MASHNPVLPHCLADRLTLQSEPGLEGHLVAVDLAILYTAPDLHNLKPSQLADGLARLSNGSIDRLADTGVRRSHQFNHFVDVVSHGRVLPLAFATIAGNSPYAHPSMDVITHRAVTTFAGMLERAR